MSGINEKPVYSKMGIISDYFYDYVNKDEVINLAEHAKTHTSDELYSKVINDAFVSNNTTDTIMGEAPAVIPYLIENIENDLQPGEMLVGDDCNKKVQSTIAVMYEVPFTIKGEDCAVSAVFDADGNLLNLVTYYDKGWVDENRRNCLDYVSSLM